MRFGRRRRRCHLLLLSMVALLLVFWLSAGPSISDLDHHRRHQDVIHSPGGFLDARRLRPFDADDQMGPINRQLEHLRADDGNDGEVIRNERKDSLKGNMPGQHGKCKPKTNFAYIKEIKCASQTLASIFRRFGYLNGLEFVLPVDQHIYLGWPYPLLGTFYRPSKTGEYNIVCEHAVFDQSILRQLMPSDTVYITSLREPFSQVKSMFNYYQLQSVVNLPGDTGFIQYLNNLEFYESVYKSVEVSAQRGCIPDGFSMTKNLMAYNLGFPTGFLPGTTDRSSDPQFIQSWIRYISEHLDTVIIVEYFMESLVLLKRNMCWQWKDVLHLAHNIGLYDYRKYSDPALQAVYRDWSVVDHALYDHFNDTFWAEVTSQGEDFTEEVAYFAAVLSETGRFCHQLLSQMLLADSVYSVAGTRWSKPFSIDLGFCRLMNEDLLPLIKEQYDRTYPPMQQPQPDKPFC